MTTPKSTVATSFTPEESLAVIAEHHRSLARHRLPILEDVLTRVEAFDPVALIDELNEALAIMPDDVVKQNLVALAPALTTFSDMVKQAVANTQAMLVD